MGGGGEAHAEALLAGGKPEGESDVRLPATPTAVVTETAQTEVMTDGCPAGYLGSQDYRRTATHRATQFPWDGSPIVQINYGPWILETDNCEAVVPPDLDVDEDAGGETGDDGGGGDPVEDSCEPVFEIGEDVCSFDGIGLDTSGSGDVGDIDAEEDDGDSFLTTAVVERRGIEADDGPTLTALSRFRDGYMMKTPKRRALVAEYYKIAPRIVAAIPQSHLGWDWIGSRIDAAIAAIATGDEDGAFGIYAAMVCRLATRWAEPKRRMAASVNTIKGTWRCHGIHRCRWPYLRRLAESGPPSTYVAAGRARSISPALSSGPVFLNRRRQPFTQFDVYWVVERYAAHVPALAGRKITPHVLRFTTACLLVFTGKDINTVRAWLGHSPIDTTNIYA